MGGTVCLIPQGWQPTEFLGQTAFLISAGYESTKIRPNFRNQIISKNVANVFVLSNTEKNKSLLDSQGY
jgi:hypothetical protein